MRESVSAVFKTETGKIFTIERQNYLSVFPGYTSFPGGKVDKTDSSGEGAPIEGLDPTHFRALRREILEELNFDILKNWDEILGVELFGVAITPEFNPYRFKAHFFIVLVKDELDFKVDKGEAKSSCWETPASFMNRYQNNLLMAVPPIIQMVKMLAQEELPKTPQNLTLPYIEKLEVPMIESIWGVKQFLPLSNTFPPAHRTNCFIMGEEPERLLIDPSPKNEEEFEKLLRSVMKIGFDKYFISHHHPDHHEFLPELYQREPRPVLMSEITFNLISQKWGSEYLKNIKITFLKDGDRISKFRGYPLNVFAVPGHDEGQLALSPFDLSWFFVGDLIQSVGTVVIGDAEGDMAKYFDSLKRVISLDPKFVIPSHGIALGGVDKLKSTLKHRLHREDQIKKLWEEGKRENEILSIIYEGLDDRLVKYAKKTIKAHLEKLGLS